MHLFQRIFRTASRRDPLGPMGERAAARLLQRKRFRLLGRNLRVPMGEADLLMIAPDRTSIVLVEVKARRVAPGEAAPTHPPELSITQAKRHTLTAILRHLAIANHWHNRPLRVDVVAVEFPATPRTDPTFRHHEGIIHVTL